MTIAAARTILDLRAHDAAERGNRPEPQALPFDIRPDDPLAAAIRATIQTLGGKLQGGDL